MDKGILGGCDSKLVGTAIVASLVVAVLLLAYYVYTFINDTKILKNAGKKEGLINQITIVPQAKRNIYRHGGVISAEVKDEDLLYLSNEQNILNAAHMAPTKRLF